MKFVKSLEQVKIIFENEDFMCVDKPSGLVVHGDGRTQEETLVDFIKEKLPDNKDIGRPHTLDSGRYTERWGTVNRLDRDTSGLILIAKNQETFDKLQGLFSGGGIIKKYTALVWGKVDFDGKNEIKITEKITRHKKDPRIWTCGLTSAEGGRQTGREAETLVRVLTSPALHFVTCPPPSKGEILAQTSVLELQPRTGRTHQLRLHCRFIGHPIVGDDKYGLNGKINEYSTRQIEKLMSKENVEADKKETLKLNATSLEFELSGQKYFFESRFTL